MVRHDCRYLPFEDESFDIVIVQGGLHHLPTLPDDLCSVITSVQRVLVPGGRLVVVEPWMTPFLRLVHTVAFSPWRHLWSKLDAFATMVEEEWSTYERWLSMPCVLAPILQGGFRVERWGVSYGKLEYVGRKPTDSVEVWDGRA